MDWLADPTLGVADAIAPAGELIVEAPEVGADDAEPELKALVISAITCDRIDALSVAVVALASLARPLWIWAFAEDEDPVAGEATADEVVEAEEEPMEDGAVAKADEFAEDGAVVTLFEVADDGALENEADVASGLEEDPAVDVDPVDAAGAAGAAEGSANDVATWEANAAIEALFVPR